MVLDKINIYEYFFQNSLDLCFVANLDGYFEIINLNLEKFLGYSKQELLKNKFTDFIHADDIASTNVEIEKLKPGNLTINFVNRYRKKDGNYIWFEWSASPNLPGGGIFAIGRDIDEQRRGGEALKFTERFLTSIIDNIPSFIFVKDAKNFKYVRINKAVEELFGYSKDEILGKSNYDLFPKEQADLLHASDVKTLNSEKPFVIGENLAHTSYKGIHTLEKKVLIKNSNGDPIYIIGMANDAAESKKIRAALDIKTKELVRSNTELEQFAYVASHDLQEPLRMVTSYLQLLEKRYYDKLDQDAKDFISFALEGSNRMRSLIHSLLEYSRINRAKPFEEIGLNLLLKDVLEDLNSSIEENSATINITKLPKICGDPALINQLFQNLIANAIKFKDVRDPVIEIAFKEQNEEYLFSVKDNGIGIKEEYLDKIFVIFKRLHSREKYPGTGMGLAICKKIVERHGGSIWVESKYGEGSTFFFTIKK